MGAAGGEATREPPDAANASLSKLAAQEQKPADGEATPANEDLVDLGGKAGLDENLLSRLAGGYGTADGADENDAPAAEPLNNWHASNGGAGLSRFADETHLQPPIESGDSAAAKAGSDELAEHETQAGRESGLPSDTVLLDVPGGAANDVADPDSTPEAAGPGVAADTTRENPLVALRRRIEAESARSGTPFYEAVLSVMLDLYADGTTKRFEIPTTSDVFDERELAVLRELQQFVQTVHRDVYRRDSIEPLAEAARDLASDLSEHLPLTIPALALCKRVDGFGQYEPLAGRKFLVNRPAKIGVYTELENFSTRLDEEGRHRVDVSQTLALYNEFGTKAWEEGPRRFVDVSRNRRRDFFLAVAVDLPALSIGTYNLKVTMEDAQSGAIAEKALEIEVVADPRMTGDE
jgi:hypothetical protein